MKTIHLLRVLAGISLAALPAKAERLREGDVVFSGSKLGQGEAIIAATGSPYTHCGIVFEKNGRLMVLEAVQPVGVISLEDFKACGNPATFLARRLKTPLAPEKYQAARSWAMAQIGRNYDSRFQWGDDKLYCSELVWKIYQHAGVELCEPRRFRDYDLGKPSVRKIINERYGGMEKIPLNEKVVAPSDLANSPQLVTISTDS